MKTNYYIFLLILTWDHFLQDQLLYDLSKISQILLTSKALKWTDKPLVLICFPCCSAVCYCSFLGAENSCFHQQDQKTRSLKIFKRTIWMLTCKPDWMNTL